MKDFLKKNFFFLKIAMTDCCLALNTARLNILTNLGDAVANPPGATAISYVDYLSLLESLKDYAFCKLDQLQGTTCNPCIAGRTCTNGPTGQTGQTGQTGSTCGTSPAIVGAPAVISLIVQFYFVLLPKLIDAGITTDRLLALYPKILNLIVNVVGSPCCGPILNAINALFGALLTFVQASPQLPLAPDSCNNSYYDIIYAFLQALCILSKKAVSCCASAAAALVDVALGYLRIRNNLRASIIDDTVFCAQLAIEIDNYYKAVGLIVKASTQACVQCCDVVFLNLGQSFNNVTGFILNPPQPPTPIYQDIPELYSYSPGGDTAYVIYIEGIRRVTACLLNSYKKILYQATDTTCCANAANGLQLITYQFGIDAAAVFDKLNNAGLDNQTLLNAYYKFLSEYAGISRSLVALVKPVPNPDCKPCEEKHSKSSKHSKKSSKSSKKSSKSSKHSKKEEKPGCGCGH